MYKVGCDVATLEIIFFMQLAAMRVPFEQGNCSGGIPFVISPRLSLAVGETGIRARNTRCGTGRFCCACATGCSHSTLLRTSVVTL